VVFGWNNSHLLLFDCLVKQNYKTQFNYTSTRKKQRESEQTSPGKLMTRYYTR